ncbi:ring finger domain-containing protein [Ditylenchus destructor]|uniref:Ring finger domain-containing protein n=1 Tax=Ditylenchus destructor TaxID=166010 RepID=A0AAD4QZ24_9BILA|nr:ring finger domain-containing protein [Ditylenchus destructor]
MDLICGICMEKLGSEKEVCCLPCGHVKHIDCLKKWSEEQKNCPNCWKRFQPAAAIRKRLYFDRDPNSDNQTSGENNETEQDDSGLATNEALKQQLEESKAEVDASQTRIKDLEESIRELERKYQISEVQLEQSSERNRQLTAELHTSESKNRELEQELSNSQARIRDLEAKFDQTDVGQLVTFFEKKSENLKNCEVSRLQDSLKTKEIELENERKLRLDLYDQLDKKDAEVAKLSDENAKAMKDLLEIQRKLTVCEKQNYDIIQDNAEMEKQLVEWQRYHRNICDAAKFGDEISKESRANKLAKFARAASINGCLVGISNKKEWINNIEKDGREIALKKFEKFSREIHSIAHLWANGRVEAWFFEHLEYGNEALPVFEFCDGLFGENRSILACNQLEIKLTKSWPFSVVTNAAGHCNQLILKKAPPRLHQKLLDAFYERKLPEHIEVMLELYNKSTNTFIDELKNRRLEELARESTKVGLRINKSKTAWTHYFKTNQKLWLEGEEIQRVKTYTYLGQEQNQDHKEALEGEIKRRIKAGWLSYGNIKDMGPTDQRIYPPTNTSQGHSPGSPTSQVQMGRPRSKKRKRKMDKETIFWEPKDSKGKTIKAPQNWGKPERWKDKIIKKLRKNWHHVAMDREKYRALCDDTFAPKQHG